MLMVRNLEYLDVNGCLLDVALLVSVDLFANGQFDLLLEVVSLFILGYLYARLESKNWQKTCSKQLKNLFIIVICQVFFNHRTLAYDCLFFNHKIIHPVRN